MLGFDFSLHLLDVSGRDDSMAFHEEAISSMTSIPERLDRLAHVAAFYAQRVQSEVHPLTEIHMNQHALYAPCASGTAFNHLPLPMSQVAASPHTARGSTSPTSHVVVAYAPPVSLHSVRDPCFIAVMIVARQQSKAGVGVAGTSISLLDSALKMFGHEGAICRGPVLPKLSTGVMGRGGFGSVHLLFQSDDRASIASGDGTLAAKRLHPRTSQEAVLDELAYLWAAQAHPNVCRYVTALCDRTNGSDPVWTLIMEACTRGSIGDIIEANKVSFQEKKALAITEDVLSGLCHIHKKGIIHRDIKPANVCMAADGRAVVVDFGAAAHTSQTARMAVTCGTAGSAAPEMLKKLPYGPKVDVFSCATVLYYALGTIMPFQDESLRKILRKNVKARLRFPDEHFKNVQPNTRKTIRLMMRVSPDERPSSFGALLYVSQASEYIEESQTIHDLQDPQDALPLPGALENASTMTSSSSSVAISKGESAGSAQRLASEDRVGGPTMPVSPESTSIAGSSGVAFSAVVCAHENTGLAHGLAGDDGHGSGNSVGAEKIARSSWYTISPSRKTRGIPRAFASLLHNAFQRVQKSK